VGADGAAVGALVSPGCEGWKDGPAWVVGAAERLGVVVGWREGCSVGWWVGWRVGWPVGRFEG